MKLRRTGLALGALALWAGCVFDRGGVPVESLSSRDAAGLLTFPDGGPPDVKPGGDAEPARDGVGSRDQLTVIDLGAVDLVRLDLGQPPCGPGTCAGCCQGNVCKPGDQLALCGAAGSPCQDCATSGKLCIGNACQACSASTQCPGDEVCVRAPTSPTGTCGPAWERVWHIRIVKAEINCSKDWEGSTSNPPDVYVKVIVGNVNIYSSTKTDACKPQWNEFTERTLAKSTKLAFEVWDYDSYNSDDWIGDVSYKNGVPFAVLKAGEIDYQTGNPSDGLLKLSIKLWPLP